MFAVSYHCNLSVLERSLRSLKVQIISLLVAKSPSLFFKKGKNYVHPLVFLWNSPFPTEC